jgi:hypothetical protein
LAKSLEGKIPTDTICIEITNRLHGKVSKSFIHDCLEKFEDLRLRRSTVIDISRKDLGDNTKVHIADAIKDCKIHDDVFQTLNGIMPDVIARIPRQVKHKILTKSISPDQVLLIDALNSMSEFASNHWRHV